MRLDIDVRVGRMLASLALGLGLATSLTGVARAQSPIPATMDPLEIVVTTSILGSVVTDLVGDRATVTVLMSNGTDPHDWSPSAQDIETVYRADLVVVNGLDLEESLHDVIDAVGASGIPVFEATDHITVRALGDGDPAADEEGSDLDHGGLDPHFWVDPVAMHAVVDALVPAIAALGVDVSDRAADLGGRLDALDTEVRAQLEPIAAERRRLVTGHESMGYFADRYGFTLVGAVIPGLSSQGEVSARELTEIATRITAEGVSVIFTEIGTPQAVVDAIADATGAHVVALPSHTLPDDGSYATFIRDISGAIAGALS